MVPGGQIALTNTVENYPGIKKTDGMTLATMMFEHAQSLGTQFVFSDVLEFSLEGKVKKIRTHEGTFEGKVIILCLGASAKQLNLEFKGNISNVNLIAQPATETSLGIKLLQLLEGGTLRLKIQSIFPTLQKKCI